MFCSIASLFNCFFTRWKKFSIGLMSGLLGETENIRTPISNIAFFTFEEFWLGSRPCRNNFSRGLLLFSKAFSKCFLTKPAKNCPVNCSSYCSHKSAPWPWAMGYKHFHHFTPRALFFPFIVHFSDKPSDYLRQAIAVVDLAWSHELVLWAHEAASKQKPMPSV